MPATLELDDIQGLLVSAYAHLPCAAYRLLEVTDRVRAQLWLADRVGEVTTAARRQDAWSCNLAFSHGGLAALGVPDDALRTFPLPFQEGMASARRSRILGDAGRSHPTRWEWGGPLRAPVHVLLLAYAADERELARRLDGWTPADDAGLRVVATLDAGRQSRDGREHFGFFDGVGQPVVEGSGRHERQARRTGHATDLPAGEFVLGYPNAYRRLAPSPTVGYGPAARELPAAPDDDTRRDLGRNGSYLVFRHLAQDVVGFRRWVTETARTLWPDDPDGATRLAAKLVGRWPSGAPLVLHPDRDPGAPPPAYDTAPSAENDFEYRGDPHGERCPLGAHVRRANPRDALGGDDRAAREAARATANRHRLLRRGRSYGPRAADSPTPDDRPRGLFFICLNADLERQFEFVQQTWLNNPAFAGLAGEVDPLVGARAAGEEGTGSFSIQGAPVGRQLCGLRSFVTVRGGAYWLLPGLRALRFIVAAAPPA